MKNSKEALANRREKQRRWKENTDPASFPHVIVKTCKHCGKNKSHRWMNNFVSTTGKPQYRAVCIDCFNRRCRELKDTEKYRNRRMEKRKLVARKRKKVFIEMLGGKCIRCGYRQSVHGLTFHHRDEEKKLFTISQKISDAGMAMLKKELKKCDLLCYNCHMELHGREHDEKMLG